MNDVCTKMYNGPMGLVKYKGLGDPYLLRHICHLQTQKQYKHKVTLRIMFVMQSASSVLIGAEEAC